MKVFLWLVGILALLAGAVSIFGGKNSVEQIFGAILLVVGVTGLGLGGVVDALQQGHTNNTKELGGIATLLQRNLEDPVPEVETDAGQAAG